MVKGFSVTQVLSSLGPAKGIIFLNNSGVPAASSGFTYDASASQATLNVAGINATLNLNSTSGVFPAVFLITGGTARSGFSSDGTNTLVASRGALYFAAGSLGANRASIETNGSFVINTAAVATSATSGFLYIAGCNGQPTGTPTSYTGRVPLVVDTTNHKLYFYSGGAWRDAGP